jgi:SAM-dependent methyltransferase
MDATVNAVQVQRWNGAGARHWIAHRQRHVELRRGLSPRLFDAAGIVAGDRVLDVGCGCGETSIIAARSAGPTGRVLGLDLSEPMLAVARGLRSAAGLPNVEFAAADAQIHPLPADSFDVVLSSFGVMFFDDPVAAFTNLFRALRPAGRLAFLCWQSGDRNELFGLPQRALTAHDAAGTAVDWGLFADPAGIVDLVASAGGTDVRIEPVEAPARLGSTVADVLDYLLGMETYRNALAELDPALIAELTQTMTALYAARARPDGVWVRTAAWLVQARKADRHTAGNPDAAGTGVGG